jgi:hypothetical protein
MNVHAHPEYLPPKTWQQFEELCAATFAADWSRQLAIDDAGP